MSPARIASLSRVGHTSVSLAEPAEDLREREVVDSEGKAVGTVRDLMVDPDERHVRFVIVSAGPFIGSTGRELMIPIDAITHIGRGDVQIDRRREEAAAAPSYDPVLAGDAGYCAGIYGWYGYTPFWQPGYAYPSERFTVDNG